MWLCGLLGGFGFLQHFLLEGTVFPNVLSLGEGSVHPIQHGTEGNHSRVLEGSA